MRKYAFIVFALIFIQSFNAQKDSLKKIRFSGIQFDIGPAIYPVYQTIPSLEKFRTIVKNDPYLNADLSSYSKQQNYVFNYGFNALLSVKGYFTISDKSVLKKEFYFGVKFGQEGNSGLYFTKKIYDTTSVYVDPNSGKKLYEVSGKESDYSFVYTSNKLIIPLGFNFTTDKKRLFWISMGIELAPVINFDYTFTSSHGEITTKSILQEGDTINGRYNYSTNYYSADNFSHQTATKIKGLGYGLFSSLPFTMYMHPFKRVLFLKHLNFLVSITPLYMYSYNKNFGSASGFNISLATGIRYNW